jgi:hypothetical protein
MIYEIQHRIETLAKNAVGIEKGEPCFASMDISFSNWDFNWNDGWKGKYWLAQGKVEATNGDEAFKMFSTKLAKIVPRIALIAQCYIDSLSQPFLLLKSDADVAFLRFIRDRGATGLMFTEGHQKALITLLGNHQIPEEFFYYWNDAVNSTGYSSKLVLMFSAIEALVKIRDGKTKDKKDWDKLELILGLELKTTLWGTKENRGEGALRHRLIHGDYFDPGDSGKDYIDLVHKKIITYFNEVILGEKLINENVVNPQRHPFGNKEGSRFFIKAKGSNKLNLKDVLSDIQKNDIYQMENYESVYDEALTKNY